LLCLVSRIPEAEVPKLGIGIFTLDPFMLFFLVDSLAPLLHPSKSDALLE
jgi:hypothetical protein